MAKQRLTPFFRTEYIQDKILAEQALREAGVEFQFDAPVHLKRNAIFQEIGPWEFYTPCDRLLDAEKLVQTLPADNLLTSPQDVPETSSAQKSWAWMIIVIMTAMIAMIIYMFLNCDFANQSHGHRPPEKTARAGHGGTPFNES